MEKRCQNVNFSLEFRRDGWEFSRFEGFLRIAFGVHAGTWLVGSWATRASWLPAAATWLVKVENIAKMVTRWYVFIGIQKARLGVFPFRRVSKSRLRRPRWRLAGGIMGYSG